METRNSTRNGARSIHRSIDPASRRRRVYERRLATNRRRRNFPTGIPAASRSSSKACFLLLLLLSFFFSFSLKKNLRSNIYFFSRNPGYYRASRIDCDSFFYKIIKDLDTPSFLSFVNVYTPSTTERPPGSSVHSFRSHRGRTQSAPFDRVGVLN